MALVHGVSVCLSLLLLFLSSIYAVPEQVHIAVTGTPSQMSVVWMTIANTSTSIVNYGTTPSFGQSTTGTVTKYEVVWPRYTSPWIHAAVISNLAADTLYYYQVGDATDGWSESFNFTTQKPAMPTSSPLNILVTADQGTTGNSTAIVNAMLKLDAAQDFSLVLFSGDISYANLHSPTWDLWGSMVQPLASHIPMMFAVGNHELFDYFEAYQHRFRMPIATIILTKHLTDPWLADGIWGNLYYSFNYGPMHVIALDSESPTYAHFAAQFLWLQEDLARVNRSATPWLIAMWHTPWYSSNTMHQGAGFHMKDSYEALMYQHHVDLVLNGHVHAYERSLPVYNGTVVSDGIVYMTDGNGGNGEGLYYHWLPQPAWSAYRESSYGFATMQIFNSTHLLWQMHRLNDSSIADQAWITHQLDF